MALAMIIIIVIAIVTSAIIYLKWSFQYWKKRNVFTLPPQLPFGNAKNLVFTKHSFGQEFSELYNDFKYRNLRYGGYFIFGVPVFIPVDLELIRYIFTRDFQYFTDHNGAVDEKADPLIGNLFSLTGAKWRALRVKLTPTFTSGKLKMMFPTLVACTKDLPILLDEFERNKESFDIKEMFARYTTDVIGSIAFGIECNCLKNPHSEFRKYGKKVTEPTITNALKDIISFMSPWLFQLFKFSITSKDVEQFFMNLVRETAEYRDKNKIERPDFMQLLLELRHTTLKVESTSIEGEEQKEIVSYYQDGLTMDEITAQAFIFFFAGYETSSTTLNFLMYELATNPEIQDKLRNEIMEVLKKHNGQITYEAVGEMKYLEKCVLETLRKYPPVSAIPRECTKTYKIPDSNVVIPKGTRVLISTYGIHHDPDFYPDPEKFDPERFSDENKDTRPPMTFLAFGEGPRICIGLRLGVLQTKVGLIAMMKDFRFTLSPKTKIPLRFDPRTSILSAAGGIWIDAHRI